MCPHALLFLANIVLKLEAGKEVVLLAKVAGKEYGLFDLEFLFPAEEPSHGNLVDTGVFGNTINGEVPGDKILVHQQASGVLLIGCL